MSRTVRPTGHLFNILTLVLLLFGAGPSMAADDMWEGVFSYQQKMADYGNPEAQVKLGEMYEEGHGTEQNYDMAQQWYQKAADQGFAPAKDRLTRLEARRKKEAEAKQRAEQERAAQKKMEQERAARKKAEEAEQAKREREEQQRAAREAKDKRLAEERAKKEVEDKRLAEEHAKQQAAEKARNEEEARKRSEEAIKKMMSVPSAYGEE